VRRRMILGGDEHLDGIDPEKGSSHPRSITHLIG
jgi:hypothetical protein